MTDFAPDASANLAAGASGSTPDSSAASEQSRAQQVAADAARKVEERAYQARDWAVSQSDTVRTTVLEKPFISVGTAFAAGIIFGMLLRR